VFNSYRKKINAIEKEQKQIREPVRGRKILREIKAKREYEN